MKELCESCGRPTTWKRVFNVGSDDIDVAYLCWECTWAIRWLANEPVPRTKRILFQIKKQEKAAAA